MSKEKPGSPKEEPGILKEKLGLPIDSLETLEEKLGFPQQKGASSSGKTHVQASEANKTPRRKSWDIKCVM